MGVDVSRETMIEYFTMETSQLIENLERVVMNCEKLKSMDPASVNEIFRIMHTIKGSSSMLFQNIAALAHSLEDVFYYVREEKPQNIDYAVLTDLVLGGLDFIRNEMQKIEIHQEVDGDPAALVEKVKEFLIVIKSMNAGKAEVKDPVTPKSGQQAQSGPKAMVLKDGEHGYKATLFFENGCGMENIRAFGVVHSMEQLGEVISYVPADILENPDCVQQIRIGGII